VSTWTRSSTLTKRVVSLHRVHSKMRHTGIEFDSLPLAYIFTFQDGRVIHHRALDDHAEALEAVREPGVREKVSYGSSYGHGRTLAVVKGPAHTPAPETLLGSTRLLR
jgi:hypothetical protein